MTLFDVPVVRRLCWSRSDFDQYWYYFQGSIRNGRLSSKEGQIILGSAVVDDVLGIILLAVVASLAKTGESTSATSSI